MHCISFFCVVDSRSKASKKNGKIKLTEKLAILQEFPSSFVDFDILSKVHVRPSDAANECVNGLMFIHP